MLRTGIAVSHHTSTGRLLGMTSPLATRNVGLRRAQYRVADDPARCLAVARALVVAKIRNQRTVLRRHRRGLAVIADEELGGPLPDWAGGPDPELEGQEREAAGAVGFALRRMQHALRSAERSTDIDVLRGNEGDAAAQYFDVFPALLPVKWKHDFVGRSRRPPRDRVNAMLSFGYALLVRDAVAALARIGLDPMLGLFHTMIPGRPALALDLIEPFRAAWVDTAVLRLVGTGGIDRDEFHVSAAGVELSDAGRRATVRAYERRAAELTTHPRFGYRMSYRRLLELEARILAKVLVGELDTYTPLWTR
jgi:CRISPR-associated protein Cas1